MHKRNRSSYRLALWLGSGVVLMFGFGYLLVPLYNVLCKAFNINGKTGGPAVASVAAVDKSRVIYIQFLATLNKNIRGQWQFRPMQKSIKLHPGENRHVEYFAENDTNHTMTVQAIPSVTPGVAAGFLKKTECFCFDQQTLAPHQSMAMPIVFHIDRDLPKNIRDVTLAYTLFDVTNKKRSVAKTTGRISK